MKDSVSDWFFRSCYRMPAYILFSADRIYNDDHDDKIFAATRNSCVILFYFIIML